MARLSAKSRKKMPAKEFAGPDRSYPVNDKAHAANAKARATQMWEAGKLSTAEREKIFAKANSKLKGRR